MSPDVNLNARFRGQEQKFCCRAATRNASRLLISLQLPLSPMRVLARRVELPHHVSVRPAPYRRDSDDKETASARGWGVS